MAPVRRNGVLLKSTGPDSGERHVGKCAHSAPGRDATRGGSPETFPPGPGTPPSTLASSAGLEPMLVQPLEPETCSKGWLCGYDDKHHPLHPDYIRRPYPDGSATEMACRCLPELRCGSHCNNRAQQAEVEQQHQQWLQTCLAKEEERKYQFYWYNDFRMLPPEERRDHPMPWDCGWENTFDR